MAASTPEAGAAPPASGAAEGDGHNDALAEDPEGNAGGDRLDRARALFAQGLTSYRAGELSAALAAFLASYRLMPNPELAYNLGRTYERVGNARESIAYYRRYLAAADPADAPAAEARAVEARIEALVAQQARHQQQVLAPPPSRDQLNDEARTFFQRGVALFEQAHFSAAMVAFTAAYRFSRLPEVIYNLAVTAEQLGQLGDAADYFREYARSLPRGSDGRREIAERVRALRARAQHASAEGTP